MPDLRRLPPGEDARVFAHNTGYVGYDRYIDLVATAAESHRFVANQTGVSESRTPFRYVWPSELDLMAKLAGMSLSPRWAAGTTLRSAARALHTSRSGKRISA